MSFLQTLKEQRYLHPVWGVVSNQPHEPGQLTHNADNLHLFTACAIRVAHAIGAVQDRDVLIESHLRFIRACEIESGLYRRFPGVEGSTSWDENIGIAYCSQQYATSVLFYGFKTDWVWAQEKGAAWSFRRWAARNFGLIPYLRARAGLTVGGVNQILWSLKAIGSALSGWGETSGKHMIWIQAEALREYPISRLGWFIAKEILARKYPGGPKEMLSIFYGEAHPIAGAAPSDWGI